MNITTSLSAAKTLGTMKKYRGERERKRRKRRLLYIVVKQDVVFARIIPLEKWKRIFRPRNRELSSSDVQQRFIHSGFTSF